jgi:hypothetical protein
MRSVVSQGDEPTSKTEASASQRERTYDENGVDLTLVRYTLGLSPTARLVTLEKFMNALASARPLAPRERK